jgi:hypothetical protein
MAKVSKQAKPIKLKDNTVYAVAEGDIVYLNIGYRHVVVDVANLPEQMWIKVWAGVDSPNDIAPMRELVCPL